MNYGKLITGIIYGFLGQIFSFLQLQGAIKYNWHEKYMIIILGSSVPITWLYIKSVRFLVDGFNGQIWPSRLIGFSIGIVVFTLFSSILFKEDITLKTTICLILGVIILMVQLLMK